VFAVAPLKSGLGNLHPDPAWPALGYGPPHLGICCVGGGGSGLVFARDGDEKEANKELDRWVEVAFTAQLFARN
jgi:hypothetical protein